MQEHSSKVRSTDLKPHRSLFERLTAFISPEPENRAELLEVLTDAQERNLIDADALAMIEGVFQVSDLAARDIMIPRSQMDAVDISTPIEEWMPRYCRRRIPVFRQSMVTLTEWWAYCWPRICCVIMQKKRLKSERCCVL